MFTKFYNTHTIRIVTIILLILIGLLPVSVLVLAQTDVDVPVGVVDEEVVTLGVESTNAEDLAVIEIDSLTDSYRREQLPGDDVLGDFVVGPGRFDLQLAPGQSRTVEMTIANRVGQGRWFSFDTEDMTGSSDPSQTVELLGDQEGPYTLRDFISVPHERFYLEHGYRARIPVTITLPPGAEPGGRYGTLLAAVTSDPADVDGAGGARAGTAVISRIGTLFFITTPGDIVRDSAVVDFVTRNGQKLFAEGPIVFDILTENNGSVHTNPYGQIVITNIINEEVGRVNLSPWYVMPQSLRTREVQWNRELLIGRYTATAQINRGYDDIIDEFSFSFYVIPWKLVALVFGGLFLFFLLIRFFLSRFEFKRK